MNIVTIVLEILLIFSTFAIFSLLSRVTRSSKDIDKLASDVQTYKDKYEAMIRSKSQFAVSKDLVPIRFGYSTTVPAADLVNVPESVLRKHERLKLATNLGDAILNEMCGDDLESILMRRDRPIGYNQDAQELCAEFILYYEPLDKPEREVASTSDIYEMID